MPKNERQSSCVLGIASSSRGFGFALMTKRNTLADWGVKAVKGGKKNERCLSHAADLIALYHPKVIALEAENHRRGKRVQALINKIAELAQVEEIEVKRLSRKQVNLEILRNEDGTKHEIAETLSGKFPEQLSFRVPKKRRLWTSEPYQTDLFDAVALAQVAA